MNYLEEKIKKEFKDVFPLLVDPTVTDIEYNPDGTLWVYRLGAEVERRKNIFRPDEVLRLIGSVATYANTTATAAHSEVGAALPWGNRFQGIIQPTVPSPCFSVRNHAVHTFPLSQYVETGRIPESAARFLSESLSSRPPANIIVSGSTGSGKTTFTGAMLDELSKLCPDDRLYIMEDTRELRVKSENVVYVLASKEISMTRLLAVALRMRPDRIIMGEVRDGSALDLLKSWNTGHPGGIVTLHANSARAALDRFEQLVLEAKDLPMSALRSLIASVANIVVHLERRPKIGPVVTEVMKVEGLDNDKNYKTEYLYRLGE